LTETFSSSFSAFQNDWKPFQFDERLHDHFLQQERCIPRKALWPEPETPGVTFTARVTRRLVKKIAKFSKSSPKSCQVKKRQNINNKAQFESQKHLQQTTFETLRYLQQIIL
jgi:hypothetical protein